MDDVSNDRHYDGFGDLSKAVDLEPLSKEDGYRWGITHIAYVKRELQKLEERALARHDVQLLHDIVASKLRAAMAEEELRQKLTGITG